MELFRIICNHSVFKSGIRTNPKTISSNPPFISLKEVKIIVDKILTKNKLAIMENSIIIEKIKEREYVKKQKANFYRFFSEHDRRRNTNFLQTFPEMEEFFRQCKYFSESL